MESEQTRLGYPKAGLFAFCVSLVAYNVLAVVRAALRAVHTRDVVEENVSTYYLIHEIKGVYQGMMIALPDAEWQPFREMTLAQLAAALKALASQAPCRPTNVIRVGQRSHGPSACTTRTNRMCLPHG